MLSIKEANKQLNQLAKTMNDPQLDDIWKAWQNDFKKRQQANARWFNNFVRIAIAATIIQLVALVFCVWYFTR
jgi:hypothetical protein